MDFIVSNVLPNTDKQFTLMYMHEGVMWSETVKLHGDAVLMYDVETKEFVEMDMPEDIIGYVFQEEGPVDAEFAETYEGDNMVTAEEAAVEVSDEELKG